MTRRTQKKNIRREMRVGGVILIALTIMVAVVFAIGGQSKLFGHKVKYRILFSGTGGLYTGDPVLLTGVEVGNVSSIGFPEDLNAQKIQVEIEVSKDVAARIRRDSRARIASASLVYGKLVEISLGTQAAEAVPEGGFIESEDPTSMTAIVDSTQGVMTDLRRLLGKDRPGSRAGEPAPQRARPTARDPALPERLFPRALAAAGPDAPR